MVTTIISIALSAIIAFFIAKWQMKKNKIVHFSINSYDIGKGLSNEFPEFQLHFGNEGLADNVLVLKGGFMNTGRNDINALKGDDDIKIILPEECKVKAVIVSPSTEGLIVTTNKDKENIINFGIHELFKSNEYFKYTAIVETSKEIEVLYNDLKFQHRILNTERIHNVYIGQGDNPKKKKFFKWILSAVIIVCVLNFFTLLYQNVHFKVYHNSTNKEVKLYIDPQSRLFVYEGLLIPFYTGTEIPPKELEKNYNIVPITTFSWNNAKTILSIVECLILLLYVALFYYLIWGKNGHIMNVIKNNENK